MLGITVFLNFQKVNLKIPVLAACAPRAHSDAQGLPASGGFTRLFFGGRTRSPKAIKFAQGEQDSAPRHL
jgi:hypothetical protein